MPDEALGNGPRKPRFNPEINYGHLLQAAVVVGGMIFAVVQFRESVSALRGEQRVLEQRMENIISDVKRTQQEEQTFRSEMRQMMTSQTNSIADLRVQIERAAAPKAAGR